MRTSADVIIIGSGVAGLSLALHLQHYRVLVLTKPSWEPVAVAGRRVA